MTIKEVAERYHLTQDTLRYYERGRMRQERLKGKAGIMETVKNAVSIFFG